MRFTTTSARDLRCFLIGGEVKMGVDQLLARAAGGSIKNRRIYRQLQSIDRLPKRDQEALARTIDAFLAKAQ